MAYLSGYTRPVNTLEPESASRSASELWSDILEGSGSSPSPDEDQPSASRSPSEQTPSGEQHYILIVEDNEADAFLIEEAIRTIQLSVTIRIAGNGEQAIRIFDEVDENIGAAAPHLIILDINLPRKSGHEVLKHMRRSARCAKAHVIVVSSSDSARDRSRMAELGAEAYFRKPSEYAGFLKLGDLVSSVLQSIPPSE